MVLTPCTLPLRLSILSYIDFTRPETHPEQLGRLLAVLRRRPTPPGRRQATAAVRLTFEVPTGALRPDSPLYIQRRHDLDLQQQLRRAGSTTIIEGARQMGKSSLVAAALVQARAQDATVVDFDFQELDDQHFSDLESLLRYLADMMYERLQLAIAPERLWQGPRDPKDQLTSAVLQGAQQPVIVGLDEVDRVFGRPYQDDFFALLRAWHNRRARDPLWRQFNLVLAYSTDPRQAIRDLNQSPFNVGIKIQLEDFSQPEVEELNARYQSPLQHRTQLTALMHYIGGHPYLMQQALYALAARTHTLAHLLNLEQADAGPFAEHLQHYRRRLSAVPALGQAMRQVIRNGQCPSAETFLQLRALGLVTGNGQHQAAPKCRLYEAYFQRAL